MRLYSHHFVSILLLSTVYGSIQYCHLLVLTFYITFPIAFEFYIDLKLVYSVLLMAIVSTSLACVSYCVHEYSCTVCVCRRTVSGCFRPPASRACCCVQLTWTPPWLRPDRPSAKPTGTDTQNCEYEDTRLDCTATVAAIQTTLMLMYETIVTKTVCSTGSKEIGSQLCI